MEKLIEESCEGFSQALASKQSVPGGGGAAALVGALGVALCAMAGNFTVGKKKYAPVEEDVKAMVTRCQALRCRLLELVDADAVGFAPLAQAYAMAKDDPAREAALEQGTWNACKAPAEMVRACAEGIELLEEMEQKGSVMLLSDVGCGALLCKAAMESGAMNVFVNTKSLRNRQAAQGLESEIDGLLEEYLPRAEAVARRVTSRVRGEN
jgi:formiminotetrahydrofolate cyclodeaminase